MWTAIGVVHEIRRERDRRIDNAGGIIVLAIIVIAIVWWARQRPGTRSLQPVMLNGGRPVEVVGESHYQRALETSAGGRQHESVNIEVVVSLVPEPRNRQDRNAIAIVLDGNVVGYLARATAKSYGPMTRRLADQRQVGQCKATIVGGWDRGRSDRGDFGIWLDLATPAKAIP